MSIQAINELNNPNNYYEILDDYRKVRKTLDKDVRTESKLSDDECKKK